LTVLEPDSKALRSAALVLDAALALGIHVGVAPDGSEIVLLAPLKVPREVRKWFEHRIDEFRAEVIAVILRENAARTGAAS
jgi:hypothetical protein